MTNGDAEVYYCRFVQNVFVINSTCCVTVKEREIVRKKNEQI